MIWTGLYVWKLIIIYWHIFDSKTFQHICNIKHRLGCQYSSQNIFNSKNFNPHKQPILLLNMPPRSQSMQRTWWPVACTTIATGSYCCKFHSLEVWVMVWQWKVRRNWVFCSCYGIQRPLCSNFVKGAIFSLCWQHGRYWYKGEPCCRTMPYAGADWDGAASRF